MSAPTIHPPTSEDRQSHRGEPDTREHFQVLRQSLGTDADYQRVAEQAQSEALALRNRLREIEATLAAQQRENRALNRALHGIQDHVDATNHENRALREAREHDQALIADLDRRLAAARTRPDRPAHGRRRAR